MAAPPIDPIAAATHPDPYPYYSRLAAAGEIAYDARCGAWIAAGAACAEAVLLHESALVRPPGEPVPPNLAGSQAGAAFASFARFNDGDRHGRLRADVEKAIAPLLPRLEADGPFAPERSLDDFIERYAVYALAAALGYAPERRPEIFASVRAFARALAADAASDDVRAADAAAGLDGLALLFQSYDATRGAIANTLLALARHPEYLREVEREPAAATTIVEETLRFDSPVQNTRRYFAQATDVGGTRVPPGETVLVLLAAANRDPRANPHPERFDPARTAPRLFTFGAGRHACPGATLATTIAAAAVRRIIAGGLDVTALQVASYKPAPNVRIPLFGR